MIKFIKGVLPYYYKLSDKTKVGDSKLIRVRINPDYQDNDAVLAHEETHVLQWYVGCFIGLVLAVAVYWLTLSFNAAYWVGLIGICSKDLLYTFSKKARLYMEVSAYRAQMKKERVDYAELYAKYLSESDSYKLDVTYDEALKLLRKS